MNAGLDPPVWVQAELGAICHRDRFIRDMESKRFGECSVQQLEGVWLFLVLSWPAACAPCLDSSQEHWSATEQGKTSAGLGIGGWVFRRRETLIIIPVKASSDTVHLLHISPWGFCDYIRPLGSHGHCFLLSVDRLLCNHTHVIFLRRRGCNLASRVSHFSMHS